MYFEKKFTFLLYYVQVEELDKWLNSMLKKIKSQENLTLNETIENLQIIYTACIKEVIRQVSLQCSERGQMLEKVIFN